MSDGIELTDEEYDTFMAVLAEQRCQHSHADTVCPPPPERAILTDLIKELRAWSDSELLNPDTELHVNRMADRAEARLEELSDE